MFSKHNKVTGLIINKIHRGTVLFNGEDSLTVIISDVNVSKSFVEITGDTLSGNTVTNNITPYVDNFTETSFTLNKPNSKLSGLYGTITYQILEFD